MAARTPELHNLIRVLTAPVVNTSTTEAPAPRRLVAAGFLRGGRASVVTSLPARPRALV